MLQRDGLFPSHPLARFMLENFPKGIRTFGELEQVAGVKAYALAACLDSERARLFGDSPDDSLLDGAMASAALPPYFGPWRVDGQYYVDGGVFTNLPLRAAIERGATQLTAFWIKTSIEAHPPETGMIRVTSAAFTMMVRNLSGLELAWVQSQGVPIRVVILNAPADVSFWDFSQSERLVEMGRRAAQATLVQEPIEPSSTWWQRVTSGWRGHGG